jgi:nucleotide-binding universal stress UspA family protein
MPSGQHHAIDRVLVGFDGSAQGRDALSLGEAIADAEDSELVVACVYEPESVFDGGDRYMPGVDMDRARAKQDAEMERNFSEVDARLAGRPYVRRERWGSPARELTVLAEDLNIDLVVVGSTHEGRLGRVLPGSVGERLLQGAPCAVAIAPLGYAKHEHFGVGLIGVGYTGSEESEVALRWAAALASRLGSGLRLIGAVPEFNPTHFPGLIGPPDYRTLTRDEVGETLATAADRTESVDAEHVVLDGPPAEMLAQQGIDLDLLVVGSRGYGPLRRALLGGVSGRVMELAPCPVIVTPRGAESESEAAASRSASEARGHE